MKKIEIYSTPTCHFCGAVKEYFKENNVEFTDYNVAEDTDKRQEMMDKTGQMGVPVISISEEGKEGSDIVIGFDKAKLSELIGI